ncbi:MAG: nuclear transport factor 2 family protein, partial [Pyrinomonadaceae bacterium]
PTKEALLTLEKAGWEAWKNNDSKEFDNLLSDKYKGFGATGYVDKAGAIKGMVDAKCEVKSYSFSGEQMHMAGPDAAFLTFKAAQDATCNGKKGPENVHSVSVYVREGDKWKNTFYAEAPVVDPKAPPAKPAAPASAKKDEAKPADKPDAATDALFAVETKAWDAWKSKDAKGLDDFAAKNMVSLSPTDGWTSRDVTLKRWTDGTCDIKSVSLTDPTSVALDSNNALLLFKSTVDGKCGGENVPAELGATLYTKEDGVWKALMTFGTPAT